MKPDENLQADTAHIRRWSGIEPPNQAALVALADFEALLTQLDTLQGELGFEDEPSSFEQALLDCREPGA